MHNHFRELIFRAIDGMISAEDFDRLQDAIERDPEVRREYLRAVGMSESFAELAGQLAAERPAVKPPASPPEAAAARRRLAKFSAPYAALAACVLIAATATAFWLGRREDGGPDGLGGPNRPNVASGPVATDPAETQIAGHATLRRALGVRWPAGADRREGDILPNGPLAIDGGVAEIDFFCGATLIVQGPARIDIESDWSVEVAQGQIRANVPPAARGFVVKAAGAEIVDLGTEFALEVSPDDAQMVVVDGEVVLRGGPHDGEHLTTGEGQVLRGTSAGADRFVGVSTHSQLRELRQDADAEQFDRWKQASQELRGDRRLIAYYPIAEGLVGRVVSNAAASSENRDGLLVGPVAQTVGRFGAASAGLEFERAAARVRTRIDGEFTAFTFACWARIDSLGNRYNALFMGDGYENGEPHWQIRDDGSLMFSVMVDDSQDIRHFVGIDQKVVSDAGLHRVYYSPPFWDLSKSGQWFHLAAVYDPAARRVEQYVNGTRVSSATIEDRFYVDKLRIGPAEIGNWGQPFRQTPWFAVRNLDGTIDELAIFDAALTAGEIRDLYENGKPVGY